MNKYKLKQPEISQRNKFTVTINADSNDGDYVTTINTYDKNIFKAHIINELIELKENYSGSHELEDCPLGEWIDIPFNGYDGFCHTLKYIKVTYVDEEGFTWDVDIDINQMSVKKRDNDKGEQ